MLSGGESQDTNAYANPTERAVKEEKERREREKLALEFESFTDFTSVLNGYEERADEESLFVWTLDKMQAIVLAMMDEWRPYKTAKLGGIKYQEYCDMGDVLLAQCSPYLANVFADIIELGKQTYYDQPEI